MNTFTAILSSTGTTETLSGDTLAMGAAAFRSLWGQTFRGEECPEEVHDVDPSGDSGIPAFLADDILPRAVTVSSIAAGGTGYVLLAGQGVDGADVWTLVTGVTEPEAGYSVSYRTPVDADEVTRSTIDTEPTSDVTLADVIETCRLCDCDADLFDAAGFRRGWVHSDGSYTLR